MRLTLFNYSLIGIFKNSENYYLKSNSQKLCQRYPRNLCLWKLDNFWWEAFPSIWEIFVYFDGLTNGRTDADHINYSTIFYFIFIRNWNKKSLFPVMGEDRRFNNQCHGKVDNHVLLIDEINSSRIFNLSIKLYSLLIKKMLPVYR